MSALPFAALAALQIGLIPLDVRVPAPPTPFLSGGQTHLVYELRVTNLAGQGRALQQIDVLDGSTVLASWSGEALRNNAVRVGAPSGTEPRVLPGGAQTLVYVMVSVPADRPPRALSHRLLVAHADSLHGPARDTLTDVLVPLTGTHAVTLAAPLAGGPWLAANGPGNLSGHRRTVIPLHGQARIPQRFATDWVKFGPDGRLWAGDSTRNDSWHGYREPLLAVAEGTVVDVKDGIPENVPFSPTRAVPITLETVGGNYVILDIGEGRYAFYAHLIPGTITVRPGDRVRPGQVLGLLGNSGNSTGPHLHFHLGDRPSPLGTEGLPFVIDRYEHLGQTLGFLARWTGGGTAESRQGHLPLQNQVVQFAPRP